ncbi:MAG: transketolase [Betaproteobacteria bacterium TMED82]|nr:MAG: transketolase [Betaproteobacteria bacterium TMED82]|tara:strand:+ start:5282 stop:7291 length:2010 start_codon:yes stop_codon:yes gene_type:complete
MANALRFLTVDAVQKCNSGHPGMPMGMAEVAVALWGKFLKHNPLNPKWANRDRFILSNGHGSMLLYSLLHLSGYAVSLKDLKSFRQLGSKTPGHPEVDVTPGVETTTGPLGQGLANGVGMALSEKLLSSEFNQPGFPVIDHKTYVFLGDGCLMEGISHEVCSLASLWGLSKLICFYDDNGISIDGEVGPWFSEDVKKRFQAYGWNVVGPLDGHCVAEVSSGIDQALRFSHSAHDKKSAPTIIICKTVIGKGSPKFQNTAQAHGQALGEEEVRETRKSLGWNFEAFEIPEKVRAAWDAKEFGSAHEKAWQKLFVEYELKFPELAKKLALRLDGEVDQDKLNTLISKTAQNANSNLKNIATRKASQEVLDILGPELDILLGGSADLTSSNLTKWHGAEPVRLSENSNEIHGRHINFGVREFGMTAICAGVALHGGFIPYCGTFLTFSDYSRNAIRMIAMMRKRVILVFTHDSIGLGEDGPTHQAIEHLSALRLIPNLSVWRPADKCESAIAWRAAIQKKDGPTAIILSRQKLQSFKRSLRVRNNIAKGAYILKKEKNPDISIIATGSELGLAMSAADQLSKQYNIRANVISIPSTTTFDRQSETYKGNLMPDKIPKIVVEAGSSDFWWKYRPSAVIGIDQFGESGQGGALFEHFGFTEKTIIETAGLIVNK